MSRDTSQISGDRRLWLSEPCRSCGAQSGLRCQTSRYSGKPTRWLHGARGWHQRPCPTCKAGPGELCRTPTGRRAGHPHTARLGPARRDLLADEQVWEELEQWRASVALVRFSGGSGNPGSISAVTLEHEDGKELARWSSGEGELPKALAAPFWGRYALFRGHPRITGLLMWNARARSIAIAGQRGGQKFDEILSPPRQIATVTIASPAANTLRDTSPRALETDTSSGTAAEVSRTSRSCERCGDPLAAGLRAEARYGGALLLKALSAGRLPRPAAPAVRPRRSDAARALRALPGPDAQRRATRGPLLLKALPAGCLPRQAQARTPRPCDRAARCAVSQPRAQATPRATRLRRRLEHAAAGTCTSSAKAPLEESTFAAGRYGARA